MGILQYVPLAICLLGLAYGFLRLAHFRPLEKRIDGNEKRIDGNEKEMSKLKETTGEIRVYLAAHSQKLDDAIKGFDDAIKKLDRIAEGKK